MAPHYQSSTPEIFQRKISDFCTLRLAPLLQQRTFENVRAYMVGLVQFRLNPPTRAGKIDWQAIALACDMESELTTEVKRAVQPGFDAIARYLGMSKPTKPSTSTALPRRPPSKRGKSAGASNSQTPTSSLRKPKATSPDRRSAPLITIPNRSRWAP
jgi:hypothetical protein